jgi:hypothetical protein
MDKFIWTQQNALDKDFCEHCIKRFEEEPESDQKGPGKVGYNRVDPSVKRSTDFIIDPIKRSDWQYEDNVFNHSLSAGINEYMIYLRDMNDNIDPTYKSANLSDSGYQIQRTLPGEFYTWHSDFSLKAAGLRMITYIWYLNDVNAGGHTEFYDGTQIKPEQGKLLLFPATWTHVHRGCPPEYETKYIVTGWLTFNCYPLMEEQGYIRRWR